MKRVCAVFLPFCLLVLAGCRPYVDSLKKTFRQAAVVSQSDLEEARSYLKREPVYDYLNTIGMLYLLWDTSVVKATAAALDDVAYGTGSITFLSDLARFILLMDGESSDWNFVLLHKGKTYQPKKYRPIDLSSAYKTIFGSKIMRFKKQKFELVFDVVDLVEPFTIKASNGSYRVTINWGEEE